MRLFLTLVLQHKEGREDVVKESHHYDKQIELFNQGAHEERRVIVDMQGKYVEEKGVQKHTLQNKMIYFVFKLYYKYMTY